MVKNQDHTIVNDQAIIESVLLEEKFFDEICVLIVTLPFKEANT